MGGAGCLFTTERSKFGEAHALIDVLKDARKAGPLDFKLKRGQLKGVIVSEKDEAKRSSAAFRRNAYDFEGLNAGHGRPDRWPARTGELAAFVSNCAAGWRLDYIRELRKHVRLDSFGACAHNNDTCPKSGKHKCDKVVMAGAYKFVFAFENTEESHYVTEKVYTGLRSGAVPIYKGAPEVLQHVPTTLSGSSSIILADSFGSPKALGEYLRTLLADPHAYEAFHKWDLPAFAKSETASQCPWQCRVCEWIASQSPSQS